jgi:hypothetical protein
VFIASLVTVFIDVDTWSALILSSDIGLENSPLVQGGGIPRLQFGRYTSIHTRINSPHIEFDRSVSIENECHDCLVTTLLLTLSFATFIVLIISSQLSSSSFRKERMYLMVGMLRSQWNENGWLECKVGGGMYLMVGMLRSQWNENGWLECKVGGGMYT